MMDDLYKTIIRCPGCEKAFEVPIDKGTIRLECTCDSELEFNPYHYSTLEELTNGSYYLPDFEQNLVKFNCELVDAPTEALSGLSVRDIEPFEQFPIPERRLHRKYVTGLCELHGLRVLVYVYFFDTLEICAQTTSYIIDRKDEELADTLMEKLKYIVATRQGKPDQAVPVNSWNDYYWLLNYGLAYLSRSTQNQVLLQLTYKSYIKFALQSEQGTLSDQMMQKVEILNWEANESGKKGDYKQCIQKSEEALELWPGNANARLLIGTALLELGDTNQAEEFLQSAIEYLPTAASAYFTLGKLYIQTGKMGLARRYLQSYLYICEKTGIDTIDHQYPIAKELLKEIDT